MKSLVAALFLVVAATFPATAADRTVGVVSTVAGVPGVPGFHDGPAAVATFNHPTWIDIARISGTGVAPGDIVVIDRLNEAIRIVSASGVSTYAVASLPYTPSPPVTFDFGGPFGGGVVVEPPLSGCGWGPYDSGMFVATTGGQQIVLVSMVGSLGSRDDVNPRIGVAGLPGSRDGLAGTPYNTSEEAQFRDPGGLTLSRGYPDRYPFETRRLYIADSGNHTILQVRFVSSFEGCPQTRVVETLAGSAGEPGSRDGASASARFNVPRGLATGPDGSIFIADSGNHTIRRMTPDGIVTTVAGVPGVTGSDDGPARSAHLNTPSGIDVGANGEIYIADTGNHLIREITPDGRLITLAGVPGVSGFSDGYADAAMFAGPVGIRVAPDGSLLISDTSNNAIRRYSVVSVPETRLRPSRR